jgi:hypothetical protein
VLFRAISIFLFQCEVFFLGLQGAAKSSLFGSRKFQFFCIAWALGTNVMPPKISGGLRKKLFSMGSSAQIN